MFDFNPSLPSLPSFPNLFQLQSPDDTAEGWREKFWEPTKDFGSDATGIVSNFVTRGFSQQEAFSIFGSLSMLTGFSNALYYFSGAPKIKNGAAARITAFLACAVAAVGCIIRNNAGGCDYNVKLSASDETPSPFNSSDSWNCSSAVPESLQSLMNIFSPKRLLPDDSASIFAAVLIGVPLVAVSILANARCVTRLYRTFNKASETAMKLDDYGAWIALFTALPINLLFMGNNLSLAKKIINGFAGKSATSQGSGKDGATGGRASRHDNIINDDFVIGKQPPKPDVSPPQQSQTPQAYDTDPVKTPSLGLRVLNPSSGVYTVVSDYYPTRDAAKSAQRDYKALGLRESFVKSDTQTGQFYLQFGAYSTQLAAQAVVDRLK